MPVWREEINGLSYYRSSLLAAFPEVVHGFFTRQGGSSPSPYHSLNLSFAVGDEPARVARNRLRLQQTLRLSTLANATQVHGLGEILVTAAHTASAAVGPEGDILITRQSGVGLLIKQADCQAVLFFDPERQVVANVHAGWRGQVQNVLAAAVTRLQELCGSQPAHLYAVISPSLGPCCAEFRHFRREFPPQMWPYQVRPHYFDLWRLSRDQLLAAGLQPQHIEVAGLCTRCREEEFFSYRRERCTGRHGSIIALRNVP
jgi:YfiH family protein